MAVATLERDERIGLGIAIVLHVALVGVLLVQPAKRDAAPIPERMTVSLATDVGLESTAPNPVAESRAAVAPVLSDEPAPVIEPMERTIIEPQRPVEVERPRPRTNPRTTTTPKRDKPTPRRTAATTPKRSPPPKRSGGSRIGADFLPGAGASTTSNETRAPAATFGAREQAQLSQAINRELKPHWRAPTGVDADRLVTVLTWEMNADGSLKGTPRVVRQSGITNSNRPQAKIHAEQAIRAVQLAAPFNLPDQFYSKWKRIRDWRFDRKL
ncbi:energy transducer TonB [Altererythrobacter sp. ZODW24]|uniref:energy transducer TonB n=1 Tax=Altererythrobacter sp. ZODW24 TaxID=2185142 RepID=UPI000DF725B7|nr:energy transducer TonB [Altererythrobacter sp. ZODW24]